MIAAWTTVLILIPVTLLACGWILWDARTQPAGQGSSRAWEPSDEQRRMTERN